MYRVNCLDCDYEDVVREGKYSSGPREYANKKKAGHMSTGHTAVVERVPDVEGFFKGEYDDWVEMDNDGYMDAGHIVAIYPENEPPTTELDMEKFTDDIVDVKIHHFGDSDPVKVYELIGESESTLLTAKYADPFMDLFDKELEDFKLYEGHNEFPVVLELEHPDWNTMIAPRLTPDDFEYQT